MHASRNRIGRAVAAFGAITGIVLQLLVVAFHGSANARLSFSHADNVQTIVICTAHGTATLAVDADGNPIERPLPLQRTTCDLCSGISALALAPPAKSFLLTLLPIAGLPRGESAAILDTTSGRTHRNRGPPSLPIA